MPLGNARRPLTSKAEAQKVVDWNQAREVHCSARAEALPDWTDEKSNLVLEACICRNVVDDLTAKWGLDKR